MMRCLRPYLTAFRLRALQETQYRAAALGGLVTQAFFGLVYVYLYSALIGDSDPVLLRETITYVWIQQMFLRLLFVSDNELSTLILSGGMAYSVIRPVDQYGFWFVRDFASRVVAGAMRSLPMFIIALLLPEDIRLTLPDGWVSVLQFSLSMVFGVMCACSVTAIAHAINMHTLDGRGISAMVSLIMLAFSGNVVPLTLFPERFQALIRYQPFAQALDMPIRAWQNAMPMGEWLFSLGVQVAWLVAMVALGRLMWRRELNNLVIQGG